MTASEVYSQLVAVFNDWQGILKDPQYIRRDDEVTWSGAVVATLPELLTREDTATISRQGQFTFRFTADNSIMQIGYRFRNNSELASARLAFYEVGTPLDEQEVDVLPWDDSDRSDHPARWVRFDYCNTGFSRVLHMDCHLHVSGLPGTRFAVTGVPTPKQFVEFVVSHFYPVVYQNFRLTASQQFQTVSTIDSINATCINSSPEDAEVYGRISHFRIPTPSR